MPKQKRKKWDLKILECILVGFYDTENLYQLWDIEKRELVKKRDVIFHEHILEHPILAREKLQLGWEITGQKTMADEEVKSEEIEEMYPVIDNLKYEEEKDIPESVLDMNMRLVEKDNMIPQSCEEAMRYKESKIWKQACENEYEAMVVNKVYNWVAVDKNVKILSAKWVFTIKKDLNEEIIKYKARIVAGGHRLKKGIDFKKTFALVAKFASLRILLTLAANNDWEGEQEDIVTAFLNGELEEEVLVCPSNGIYPRKREVVTLYSRKSESEEILENKADRIMKQGEKVQELVWYLNKSLYSLRQSPRCFYNKLDSILKKKRYIRIKADYEVYIMEKAVVLIVHVDDMLIFGSVDGKKNLKGDLEEVLVMKWIGSLHDTMFVGLRVRRIRELHIILILQEKYTWAILTILAKKIVCIVTSLGPQRHIEKLCLIGALQELCSLIYHFPMLLRCELQPQLTSCLCYRT